MAHIMIDGALHPTNTQEEIEAAQAKMTARAIDALLAPLSPELRAMALARIGYCHMCGGPQEYSRACQCWNDE